MSDNQAQSKEELLEALGDISDTDNSDGLEDVPNIDDVDIFADEAKAASTDAEEPSEDLPDLEEKPVEESSEDPVEETEVKEPSDDETSKEELKVEGIDDIKDITFKIKVDGKEVELTGAEMARRASGDIAVEKRFTELDKREKLVQDRELSHKSVLESYKNRFESGDIYGALSEMFETPAYLIKDKMISSLGPEFERRSQLTDDQLALQRKLEEGKFYKDSYESELKKRQEEQRLSAEQAERNALNQEISEARETHNISEEAWEASFKELDESLPPEEAISTEMVVENYLSKQSNDISVDVTETVNSVLGQYEEHINDAFRQQFEDFVKLSPELTEDELDYIVKTSISQSLKQNLETKPKQPSVNAREEFFRRQEEQLINDLKSGTDDSDTNWF